jgi:uncharacterized protein YggE
LPCAVSGAPELKGSPEELSAFLQQPLPTVNIVGRAEESAYADKAKITLIITTEDKLMATALTTNGTVRESITKQFVAAGIPEDSINTSKFSTSPQYGWFGEKPKSYEVVNRMQVEVDNEAHLKVVAESADSNPEVDFVDIEFEHTGRKALQQQVLDKAVADVMQQKAFYEEQLGLTLRPQSFTAPNVAPRPRPAARRPMAMMEEITVTARKSGSAPAYADEPIVAVTFDEVEYNAVVTVVFEVAQPE